MNIGIIGAGNVGTGLTKRLVQNGHTVMLSFSKDLEQLRSSAASLGARAGTPVQAVEFAEIVILATPWVVTSEALRQVGNVSKRPILWDCTNALKPDLSGLSLGTTTSGGEEVAKLAPWARVVKAIPPFAELLHSPSMLVGGARIAVFVCGDDAEARHAVSGLLADIGADAVDAGPLTLARYTEPAAMLLVDLAYKQGLGSRIGLTLIQEARKR